MSRSRSASTPMDVTHSCTRCRPGSRAIERSGMKWISYFPGNFDQRLAGLFGADRAQRSRARAACGDHGGDVDHLRADRGLRRGGRTVIARSKTPVAHSALDRMRRARHLVAPRAVGDLPEPRRGPRRVADAETRRQRLLRPDGRRGRRGICARSPTTNEAVRGMRRSSSPRSRKAPKRSLKQPVVGARERDRDPARRAGCLGRSDLCTWSIGSSSDSIPGLRVAREQSRPGPRPARDAHLLWRHPARPTRRAGPRRTSGIMAIPTGIGSIDISLAWEIFRRAAAAGVRAENRSVVVGNGRWL